MDALAQRAIQEALHKNWKEAVKLNQEILKNESKDKEALNRLARAYSEIGNLKKALSIYKKVIRLDPYNNIAQKAIKKLNSFNPNSNIPNESCSSLSNSLEISFIEEPGKTKTVLLIHLGDQKVLDSLDATDSILLSPHAHRVSVVTKEGKFIGRLPDDLSRRMIKLIRSGNQYECFVRSVNSTKHKKEVRIFIREVKRAERIKDIPSFPTTEKNNYVSFTPPEFVHREKPELEDEESEE